MPITSDLTRRMVKLGLMDAKVMGVDVNTLVYQVPGGMLSNWVSPEQAGKPSCRKVLNEVPRKRDFGSRLLRLPAKLSELKPY